MVSKFSESPTYTIGRARYQRERIFPLLKYWWWGEHGSFTARLSQKARAGLCKNKPCVRGGGGANLRPRLREPTLFNNVMYRFDG